jgi:hypothetical protein
MIQFCPRFFQEKEQRHIEDVVNDYKKANKKMSPGSLPSLRTYEHALMHEWMHCNVFGFLPYNKDSKIEETDYVTSTNTSSSIDD